MRKSVIQGPFAAYSSSVATTFAVVASFAVVISPIAVASTAAGGLAAL